MVSTLSVLCAMLCSSTSAIIAKEEYRLPSAKVARYTLAAQIGQDGYELLHHVYHETAPAEARELAAIHTLRQVWIQQFHPATVEQTVQWRTADDLPPAPLLISSPYDPEARYGKKRDVEWMGYKVHLTETCDDDLPHVITDVVTTPATTTDFAVLPTIQARLAGRDLVPAEQLLDAGYVSSDHLLTSARDHAIDLIGPVGADHSWQAQAQQGFDAARFQIDWDAKHAICPTGQTSVVWMERERPKDGKRPFVQITWSKPVCAICPQRHQCTRSATSPRMIQVQERDHYEELRVARQRQGTDIFKGQYARRAGIEGTIAQGTHLGDLRRSRYRGLAKTHLLHVLIAAALNFMRVAA